MLSGYVAYIGLVGRLKVPPQYWRLLAASVPTAYNRVERVDNSKQLLTPVGSYCTANGANRCNKFNVAPCYT